MNLIVERQIATENGEKEYKPYAKFEEAYSKINHEQERQTVASNKHLKYKKMRKFLYQIGQFQSLDPEITDIDFAMSFFGLLKKNYERDIKGFWGNRQTLWKKIADIRLLWIDLYYMKEFYRPGDLFLDSIVSPEEYKPYIVDSQYLFLGWFTLNEVEDPWYNHTIDYFDVFLRGYNIGDTMQDLYCYHYDLERKRILPYGVLEHSNGYWARSPFWFDMTFETEKELLNFLSERSYEAPWDFMEELRKREIPIVKTWDFDTSKEEDSEPGDNETEIQPEKKAKLQ